MKPIHEILSKRRSSVLFSDRPIESEIIESLFEAARWAPSSMNQQPWRFIYTMKNDSSYPEWLHCLNEKNREWAQNAPMLILTAAQIISDYNNRENPYAVHDTAMAYSNLVFQAVSSGLSIHPMGGYDKEMISKLVGLRIGYRPLVIAALGYKSDSNDFPQHLLNRENTERKRKPVREIAFRQHYTGN